MAELTNIMSHVCPNICKECKPQCKKWQEMSNLEGHELMKFIKTQHEIAGNEGGSPPRRTNLAEADVTSSAKPSPPQRQEYLEAKMTSCCVTCDTILQQISILLEEIWEILEPQRKVCDVCRLEKHGKCNCQQVGWRFNMPSTKEGFLSWLTKLRHILLKVLEGVTRSKCKIYKGEPKDELERLLQDLRLPLQKQARDIRITSLTRLPLSSTDRDESLVASLIENTELLEKVLSKIKAEGRQIEMKVFEDERFQPKSKPDRLPELKVISSPPFPSSMSSFTSDHTMFPAIPGKAKLDREELKSTSPHAKDNKGDQYKRDISMKMDQASSYEKKYIVSKDHITVRKKDSSPEIQRKLPSYHSKHTENKRETQSAVLRDKQQIHGTEKSKSSLDHANSSYEKKDKVSKDRIVARKKDSSPHIQRNLPTYDSKHTDNKRDTQSAVIRDKQQILGTEKSKSSLSPTEKSTRKSLKQSVSFPGMLGDRKTKGKNESAETERPSNITDPSIEELRKARARASTQHLDTNYKGKRRTQAESSRRDNLQSKGRINNEEDIQSSPKKLTKHREKSVEPKLPREDKLQSKDKMKGEKNMLRENQHSKSTQSSRGEILKQSKGSMKHKDTESPQSKSMTEGKSSTRDKSDIRRFKKQGKSKDKELESMSNLGNVKIKQGSKSKSTIEWASIDKRGDSEQEVHKNKKKLKKEISKEKPEPLPKDKETYTRRHTVQIPSKLILKKMRDQRVEELRAQRRIERIKDKPVKKLKSLKSLPNLEILREKLRERKRKQAILEVLESDLTECASTPEPLEMIRGKRVVLFEPMPKQEYDGVPEPLLFKVKADLVDDDYLVKFKPRSESAIPPGSQKLWAGKGIIEYKLSNPKYIELGYTKLPTVTVMRKSIVYKMEQPHPKDDWFRRHKRDGMLFYDTCEKLAEIDDDGHGRWYYKNGRMALNYCAAEGKDVRNRYIVYSSGENDSSGNPRCDTILASFDHLGNGIVYDHCGNVRLKYNQNEGENFDKTICPLGRWKWHSLNTSLSALQNEYVEQRVKLELDMFEDLADQEKKVSEQFEETAGELAEEHKKMFTIEMSNFFKEKNQMLLQKYQPFQLKMKALKLNEQFSLRIYEQRKIYLYFNAGIKNLKLNLGLVLIPNEILGTETVNLREIMTPFDRVIPQSDSVANILDIVSETRRKIRRKNSFSHKFNSGIRNSSSPLGVIR